MGTSDDMKKLCEDIIASYDMRVKDVHNMLKGFQAEHNEMSAKLKADLAKGEKDRLKEFQPWWTGIQTEVQGLLERFAKENVARTNEVNGLLDKFAREHAAMAVELKKALAKGERERVKEFDPWWAGIRDEVQGLLGQFAKENAARANEVNGLLDMFAREHAAMAVELKKALTKGETQRLKEFEPWWAGIQCEVEALLSNFAKESKIRAKEVKALLEKFAQEEVVTKEEVLNLLASFRAEQQEMAANWQALMATMAKRREGHPAPPQFEAGKKVTTTTVEEILGEGQPKRKTAKKSPAKKEKKELVHSLN